MVQVIEQVRSLFSRCLFALSAPRALPAPTLPYHKEASSLPTAPLQVTAQLPAHLAAAVADELSFRVQAILQRAVLEDASSSDRSTLVLVGLKSAGTSSSLSSTSSSSHGLLPEPLSSTLLH